MNMLHPASLVPLPCFSAMPCTFRSSNAIREYREMISLAVLCNQSFLVLAIFGMDFCDSYLCLSPVPAALSFSLRALLCFSASLSS